MHQRSQPQLPSALEHENAVGTCADSALDRQTVVGILQIEALERQPAAGELVQVPLGRQPDETPTGVERRGQAGHVITRAFPAGSCSTQPAEISRLRS